MADELLQMFQSITTSDHDELVEQFAHLLQVDAGTAAFFLESSNWNVETAVNMYLSTMEAPDGGLYFSARAEAPPSGEDLDMDDGAQSAAGGGGPDASAFSNAPVVDLQARFLSDLSQSQNMLFEPNTSINMQWTFVNTGSAPWPSETTLVYVQGSDFGGPQQIPVAAAPGERIDIQTALRLPSAAGSYAGSWRLRAPQGFFGDPIWVVLNVGHGGAGLGEANQQLQQGVAMPVNPLDPSKVQELHAAGAGSSGASGAAFAPGVVEDMDL